MANITYYLPVMDTIKTAWEKVSGAKASIWVGFIMVVIIMIGLGFLIGMLKMISPGTEALLRFVAGIINYLLTIGLLYIGLERAFDKPVSFSMIFHPFKPAIGLRIIGLYILQMLIFLPVMCVIIGVTIFAMTAGIITKAAFNFTHFPAAIFCVTLFILAFFLIFYLAVRMMLSMGFVLDKESNPWQAIKQSFAATQSNFWRIFAVAILQFLIILVSMIPLLIGLIWTIPFAYVCYGVMYRNLAPNAEGGVMVTPTTPAPKI